MIDVIADMLNAGLDASVKTVVAQAVVDAYGVFRSLIWTKHGKFSPVSNALESLEAEPESAVRRAALSEEFAAAKVDDDVDLQHALGLLREAMSQFKSENSSSVQEASGKNISQANNNSNASVSVSYGIGTNRD